MLIIDMSCWSSLIILDYSWLMLMRVESCGVLWSLVGPIWCCLIVFFILGDYYWLSLLVINYYWFFLGFSWLFLINVDACWVLLESCGYVVGLGLVLVCSSWYSLSIDESCGLFLMILVACVPLFLIMFDYCCFLLSLVGFVWFFFRIDSYCWLVLAMFDDVWL